MYIFIMFLQECLDARVCKLHYFVLQRNRNFTAACSMLYIHKKLFHWCRYCNWTVLVCLGGNLG